MTTNLERAREFVDTQGIQLWESQEAYKEAIANLAALLTQVQAEARLEEARWWREQTHEGAICSPQDCTQCERIAALAQAAAPATKEE